MEAGNRDKLHKKDHCVAPETYVDSNGQLTAEGRPRLWTALCDPRVLIHNASGATPVIWIEQGTSNESTDKTVASNWRGEQKNENWKGKNMKEWKEERRVKN
jgi:hypothetical protein